MGLGKGFIFSVKMMFAKLLISITYEQDLARTSGVSSEARALLLNQRIPRKMTDSENKGRGSSGNKLGQYRETLDIYLPFRLHKTSLIAKAPRHPQKAQLFNLNLDASS